MPTHQGSPDSTVNLQSVSVNLIGLESNAQFVNPLTLQWNRVVDETWVCEMGSQLGLTHSSFTYTNGVQVEAAEENVTFRHRGSFLTPETVLSVELARRYVEAFGPGDWMAISTEFLAEISPKVFLDSVDTDSWPRFESQLSLNAVLPRFGANVLYSYPDRILRVELSRDLSSEGADLTCIAWIHRELSPNPNRSQGELQSALEGWESDWAEVVVAATQLFASTLDPRGSL